MIRLLAAISSMLLALGFMWLTGEYIHTGMGLTPYIAYPMIVISIGAPIAMYEQCISELYKELRCEQLKIRSALLNAAVLREQQEAKHQPDCTCLEDSYPPGTPIALRKKHKAANCNAPLCEQCNHMIQDDGTTINALDEPH